MQTLIIILFKLFSLLPLKFLHALGDFWGGIACRIMSEDRRRVIDNLTAAQLPADDRTVKAVFQETAKGGLELPVAFFRRPWMRARDCCLSRRISAATTLPDATSASSFRFR